MTNRRRPTSSRLTPRAIGDARNQYTLGYTPKAGIGGYRQIEVRVRRPDVKVYAKDGYYPLPTAMVVQFSVASSQFSSKLR